MSNEGPDRRRGDRDDEEAGEDLRSAAFGVEDALGEERDRGGARRQADVPDRVREVGRFRVLELDARPEDAERESERGAEEVEAAPELGRLARARGEAEQPDGRGEEEQEDEARRDLVHGRNTCRPHLKSGSKP